MEILYEDNHIIAINKTNSDIVQVDKTGDLSLEEKIKSYIKEKYNKPGDVFLGVVHRIDRPVSGAVVFARTSKALTRLNDMFKNKDVQKTYWAIVKEKPKKELATLNHYIVRDQQKNKSFAFDNEVKTKTGKPFVQISCKRRELLFIRDRFAYRQASSNKVSAC